MFNGLFNDDNLFFFYRNCNYLKLTIFEHGLPWSWSYGSWINNYLYNQCLSPL